MVKEGELISMSGIIYQFDSSCCPVGTVSSRYSPPPFSLLFVSFLPLVTIYIFCYVSYSIVITLLGYLWNE